MVLVTKVIIYLTKNENKSSYMKIFMIEYFTLHYFIYFILYIFIIRGMFA